MCQNLDHEREVDLSLTLIIHFQEGLLHTTNKYEKHFPKMYRDVGMAVPKTTQTRYMDGSVQAT